MIPGIIYLRHHLLLMGTWRLKVKITLKSIATFPNGNVVFSNLLLFAIIDVDINTFPTSLFILKLKKMLIILTKLSWPSEYFFCMNI